MESKIVTIANGETYKSISVKRHSYIFTLGLSDLLHIALILISALLFISVFYSKLAEVQIGQTQSPFTRVVRGAITSAVAPVNPSLAHSLQYSILR